MKHRLFRVEDLPPGSMVAADLNGIGIVLIRSPTGSFHALRDTCPHMRARLSRGWLKPGVTGSDVGVYEITDEYVVRCPWHGYEFDVRTGRCAADPQRARVRTYEVTVEGGHVYVER